MDAEELLDLVKTAEMLQEIKRRLPEIVEEMQQLRAWKTDAMTVLESWTKVWEALGEPEVLGGSMAVASLEMVTKMRDALLAYRNLCDYTLNRWDKDDDVRVGKMLHALAGHGPGYRSDIDNIHAVITALEESNED